MADTHHLSQAAYDRLKAEHDELTTVGRVEIARKIEAARELGDLKENGDYHAAKDHQGQMEARIRQLAAMLENAEIVEGTDGDVVEPGAVVQLRYAGDDDVETYFFGSVEERGVEHDTARYRPERVDDLVAHHRRVLEVADAHAPSTSPCSSSSSFQTRPGCVTPSSTRTVR